MINKFLIETTKKANGFERSVFNLKDEKPSYIPPEKSDLEKLLRYLNLINFKSDYFVRVYLSLLHFYFPEEDTNITYTHKDLEVGFVNGIDCDIILESPKFIFPETDHLKTTYPFDVDWEFRKISNTRIFAKGLNFDRKVESNVIYIPESENDKLILQPNERFFPFKIQVSLPIRNAWTMHDLILFGAHLEPSFFPVDACLENLPDKNFVNDLLKQTGYIKRFLQNISNSEKLALILKAIVEYNGNRN